MRPSFGGFEELAEYNKFDEAEDHVCGIRCRLVDMCLGSGLAVQLGELCKLPPSDGDSLLPTLSR